MNATRRPATLRRRFARKRIVGACVALIAAAIAALAVGHVPHPVSLSAALVGAEMPDAMQPAVTAHLGHVEAASTLPDSPCSTCGGEQDGAALACALILLAIAIMRLAPRTTARLTAWVGRCLASSRWSPVISLPRAPSLHALCISRT